MAPLQRGDRYEVERGVNKTQVGEVGQSLWRQEQVEGKEWRSEGRNTWYVNITFYKFWLEERNYRKWIWLFLII